MPCPRPALALPSPCPALPAPCCCCGPQGHRVATLVLWRDRGRMACWSSNLSLFLYFLFSLSFVAWLPPTESRGFEGMCCLPIALLWHVVNRAHGKENRRDGDTYVTSEGAAPLRPTAPSLGGGLCLSWEHPGGCRPSLELWESPWVCELREGEVLSTRGQGTAATCGIREGPCSRQSARTCICNFSYSWPACSIFTKETGGNNQSWSSLATEPCAVAHELQRSADAGSSQALFPLIRARSDRSTEPGGHLCWLCWQGHPGRCLPSPWPPPWLAGPGAPQEAAQQQAVCGTALTP